MPLRIAVVGAGIAGLSAASALQNISGIDVSIFEASDRLGGRIWTKYEQKGEFKSKLELGANWIHGIRDNPIHKISLENNLYESLNFKTNPKLKFRRNHTLVVHENGDEIDLQIYIDMRKHYSEVLEEADKIFHDQTRREKMQKVSFSEYVRKEMTDYIDENGFGIDGKGLIESLLIMEASVSGCDSMDDVSLSEIGSYRSLGGRHAVIHQGYESVIKCIASEIPSHSIQLSTPVKKISISDERTLAVILELDDREEVFDAVIVTSSLSFLQHNKDFICNLPSEKIRAIDNLGMGVVNKIYLEFHDLDFIPSNVYQIVIAKKKFEPKDGWMHKIQSFGVVPVCERNTLLAWITGEAAKTMEVLPEEEVIDGCVQVLTNILNRAIPRPLSALRTQWGSHPYIRGAYSYIPLGATVDDIHVLSKPILGSHSKPMVFFAGEATHSEFYSTVHGAYLSGQREAENIIKSYQLVEN